MMARWLAFVVWALVVASAVFWGTKLFVRPLPAPAHAGVAAPTAALRGDLARILGADPPPKVQQVEAPPPEASRFQLVGVVAPRNPAVTGQGVALISVDGKAPKAYKVGASVDAGNVLQSVRQRSASLGPRGGAALIALELPALPPAATGTLQPAQPGEGAAPALAVPPGLRPPGNPAVLPVVRPGPFPGGIPRPQPFQQQPMMTPNPGAMGQPDNGNGDGNATR